MKREENHEVLRVGSGRVLTYVCIYVVILALHMLFLREIPFSSVLPVFIILFTHFFYMRYEENHYSPLCNYSPIYFSISILFFVLIFISELFIDNVQVTLVIGILGAMVLSIVYCIALFIVINDAGL